MEDKKNKLSIIDCEETIKIIMNSGEYSLRKGVILEKLHNQIVDYENRTIKVKGYKDYTFNSIDCMISDNEQELGFFKNHQDVRPSQATYIKKEDAEHLFNIFTFQNND